MIRLFLFPDQYFDIFCYIYKSSLFEWLLMNFICQILDKMKKGDSIKKIANLLPSIHFV